MEERRPLPSVQAMANAPLYPVDDAGANVIVHVFVACGARVRGVQPFTAKLAPFTTARVMVTLVLLELVKRSERLLTVATGTPSKWIAEGFETSAAEAAIACGRQTKINNESKLKTKEFAHNRLPFKRWSPLGE